MPELEGSFRDLVGRLIEMIPWKPGRKEIKFQKVREIPKGTRIEAERNGETTLRFKAGLRSWWTLPYFVAAASILGAVPLGMFFGFAIRKEVWSPFNGGAFFWTIIIFALATFISFRIAHPWVKVVATPRYVRVGRYFFDRAHYGGMRLGYEIPLQNEAPLKNDFHDLSLGLVAMRLSYGLWGEDLPYLVNKYHATEVVLWLNYMIAKTEPRPVEPDASSGTRPQSF